MESLSNPCHLLPQGFGEFVYGEVDAPGEQEVVEGLTDVDKSLRPVDVESHGGRAMEAF